MSDILIFSIIHSLCVSAWRPAVGRRNNSSANVWYSMPIRNLRPSPTSCRRLVRRPRAYWKINDSKKWKPMDLRNRTIVRLAAGRSVWYHRVGRWMSISTEVVDTELSYSIRPDLRAVNAIGPPIALALCPQIYRNVHSRLPSWSAVAMCSRFVTHSFQLSLSVVWNARPSHDASSDHSVLNTLIELDVHNNKL